MKNFKKIASVSAVLLCTISLAIGSDLEHQESPFTDKKISWIIHNGHTEIVGSFSAEYGPEETIVPDIQDEIINQYHNESTITYVDLSEVNEELSNSGILNEIATKLPNIQGLDLSNTGISVIDLHDFSYRGSEEEPFEVTLGKTPLEAIFLNPEGFYSIGGTYSRTQIISGMYGNHAEITNGTRIKLPWHIRFSQKPLQNNFLMNKVYLKSSSLNSEQDLSRISGLLQHNIVGDNQLKTHIYFNGEENDFLRNFFQIEALQNIPGYEKTVYQDIHIVNKHADLTGANGEAVRASFLRLVLSIEGNYRIECNEGSPEIKQGRLNFFSNEDKQAWDVLHSVLAKWIKIRDAEIIHPTKSSRNGEVSASA